MIPTNPRLRMYFPIIMPLDENGDGPCEIQRAAKITFEVWDSYLVSFGSYDFLLDAVERAELLNHAFYIEGKREIHQ